MALSAKEFIPVLKSLQVRDQHLHKLKARLDAVPKEIEALRKTIEEEKARTEAVKAEAKRLAVVKKEKELELASKEESIKKHQGELNAVKSNEAFKALQKEIDAAKEAKDKLEEDLLGLMDQVDAANKNEKDEAKRVEGVKAQIEAKVKELEASGAALKQEFDAAQAERDAAAAAIPPEGLKQYDAVRKRRPDAALAKIVDGVCQGCHLRTPAGVVQQVMKAAAFVLCEGCQRILYVEDKPAAEKPAEAAPPAA